MRPSPTNFCAVVASILVVLGSAGSDASAQAWVGDKGALDLGLDYNLGLSDKIVTDVDVDLVNAGVTSHQLTLGAEYVPVRNLAVSVELPFVALKYVGAPTGYEHPGGGRYDDRKLHGTLTDLRAGARYQVLAEPIALSPHLGVSIPVADYETVGNAVAGRHLKALHLGLGIGTVFAGTAYVHLLYEFSLVEKYDRTPMTEQFGQNRSDLAFTIGYKLLDQRLDVHLDANLRETHDGLNFNDLDFRNPTDLENFHDPILDEDMILAGAGVGYQLTNTLGVSLAGRLFVTGDNTLNASVLAFGVTWSPL